MKKILAAFLGLALAGCATTGSRKAEQASLKAQQCLKAKKELPKDEDLSGAQVVAADGTKYIVLLQVLMAPGQVILVTERLDIADAESKYEGVPCRPVQGGGSPGAPGLD